MAANSTQQNFTAFFHHWLTTQHSLLDEINSELISPLHQNDVVVKDRAYSSLVDRVILHYNRFHEEKSRAANRSPFLFFSPPWLTPYERTLLWVSGFKPSVIFKLINSSSVGEELTEEQRRRVEEVRTETRRREREVTEEMASVQESVAAPPIYALMREDRRLVDGEVDELGDAMEALKGAMKRVMEDADAVRESTVMGVLEVMSPKQRIRFLEAAGRYQLQARRWGMQRGSF